MAIAKENKNSVRSTNAQMKKKKKIETSQPTLRYFFLALKPNICLIMVCIEQLQGRPITKECPYR